ncbi:MAG: ABC transporter permease [Terriglobales bacterium]
MLKIVATRIVAGIGVLLVLVAIVFFLQKISPINPARAMLGGHASAAQVAAESKKLGYDKPIVVQYVRYIENVVQGNFGVSAVTHGSVGHDLVHFGTASVELMVASFLLAIVLALLFAVATVLQWRGSGVLRAVMYVLSACPVYLLALGGIILFYSTLHVLPYSGQVSAARAPTGPTGFLIIDSILHLRFGVMWDAIVHLILPASCLAIGPAVAIGRVLRSSLQHSMRSDYVRTARMKGMSELRVTLAHGLRNSIGPALALGGVVIAGTFGFLIVIEDVFSWPGLGSYMVQAISIGDDTTISAVTLVLGALFVISNVFVDIFQAIADPRIRT